jgi:hypothetical protein
VVQRRGAQDAIDVGAGGDDVVEGRHSEKEGITANGKQRMAEGDGIAQVSCYGSLRGAPLTGLVVQPGQPLPIVLDGQAAGV